MARLPRLSVAHHVHLITLNGHGSEGIFRDDEDRIAWLGWLAEYARAQQVAVHAFVMLDHRIRLLATPITDDGVPRWMQSLGRHYGRYFNDRYRRRGTLWDGRYRCTIIEAASYTLAAMMFMDLEPVREGVVGQAQDHRWTSLHHYLGHVSDRFLVAPAAYWALGNTPFAREMAYAHMLQAGEDERTVMALHRASMKGWALGPPSFVAHLEQLAARRVTPLSPGRPRKTSA